MRTRRDLRTRFLSPIMVGGCSSAHLAVPFSPRANPTRKSHAHIIPICGERKLYILFPIQFILRQLWKTKVLLFINKAEEYLAWSQHFHHKRNFVASKKHPEPFSICTRHRVPTIQFFRLCTLHFQAPSILFSTRAEEKSSDCFEVANIHVPPPAAHHLIRLECYLFSMSPADLLRFLSKPAKWVMPLWANRFCWALERSSCPSRVLQFATITTSPCWLFNRRPR